MRWLLSSLTLGIACLLPVGRGPSSVAAQAPGGYGPPPMQPGSGPPAGTYGPPQPVTKAEVGIHDGYFDPPIVLVTPGATVRFVNRGRHKHTVTDLAGKWDSRDLEPGGAYTFTAKSLHAHYYCRHHRLSMNGKIIVHDPASAVPLNVLNLYPSGGGYSGGPKSAPGSYGGYGPRPSGGGYQGMMRPGMMPYR
ncbi:MAG: hypothetical protein L0Z62_44190 [Gemmataceae bacterium]|nr:hypothetical protein [Gemmataceae bacterium]